MGRRGCGGWWARFVWGWGSEVGVSVSRLGNLLKRSRAMVFDFDGTLVDSNPIKRRAFARCFAEFPDQLEEILAYCWNNHHVPRGDKFRHVYEQILRRPYTPEAADGLHRAFDAATTRQIIEGPEIPGAVAFLRKASQRGLTALLSSTPHETLGEILARRGWSGYFAELRGAPVNKSEWLRQFHVTRRLETEDVVFFGDTQEDAAAAQAAGVGFVAVAQHGATPAETPAAADFMALTELI